ncbi:hypothetical protein R9C00_12600 [Flammeovirgaceae bacterium SG7u.111]|nr:hypothetical protein [Flammeovirgaceae bacterium SG7u.132]WPO38293.1 hypothetical protein R9C00_12600 [Flammeovirgaceae bacterium SG7u.111]
MNTSVKDVTLNAVFVSDILSYYDKESYQDLHAMAEGTDLSDPNGKVSMELYNNLCAWIEENLGKFNLIIVGRKIGETVYETFRKFNMLQENATPIDAMNALKMVASSMIQDPEGRGWEIISFDKKEIVMRRTQTFNSKLQLGLLDGLVRKTNVSGVKVDYLHETALGAEYDDYIISWL